MIPQRIKIKNRALPDKPGVYLMKNGKGRVIYVGKAASLKRRVSSYFNHPHPLTESTGERIEQMVEEIREIDYIEKPTAIEALILEANLIKYYFPPFNIKDKDNKSFLYLVITKEDFPKPLLIRGHELGDDASKKYQAVFGPYTSPKALRAALDLVRKIFPWSVCGRPASGVRRPACFYYHLKLCPGVCIGVISKREYGKIIRDLIKFFEGKKDYLLKAYKKEMKAAAKEKKFEQAADLRNKIYFLEHIRDIAIIKREDEAADKIGTGEAVVDLFGRIEGYDVSNISGTATTASMVVFENGAPAKAEYRKFRIRTVRGPNDPASMREALTRRLRNAWRRPDLILIDGGWPQVNAAMQVAHEFHLNIPIVGLAKGAQRKKNSSTGLTVLSKSKDELICDPSNVEICKQCEKHKNLLIQVRDEAHRFAVRYHKLLRGNHSSLSLRGAGRRGNHSSLSLRGAERRGNHSK